MKRTCTCRISELVEVWRRQMRVGYVCPKCSVIKIGVFSHAGQIYTFNHQRRLTPEYAAELLKNAKRRA